MPDQQPELANIQITGSSKQIITCPNCQHTVQVQQGKSHNATQELNERLNVLRGNRKRSGRKLSATPIVLAMIDLMPEVFTIYDVREACGDKASERTIRNVLNRLRKDGSLVYVAWNWSKADSEK